MNKIIELKNISKSFDGEMVLDNISLDIHDNEFITLLGPSGCGKTTTLRIIGGFAYPDQGDVIFMGDRINDVPPHKRNVNTVFQKYALFPHLNVFENVAFPLRERKLPKQEIKEQVEKMRGLENKKLPQDVDYKTIKGLRLEAQEKLNQMKPLNVGQAGRISGVNPADVSVLLIWLAGKGGSNDNS